MPIQLISATGYIAAVVAAGVALYQWRRSSSLYALLVESANRFEELRQRGAAVEQSLFKAEGKNKQHAETTQRLTAAVDEGRSKNADLVRRLEQKEVESKLIIDRLDLQKSNLQKQQAIILESQRLAEQEVQTLREQLAQQQRLHEAERLAAAEERALVVKDWQARLAAAEAKHQADKQAKSIDPLELRRLKRKVAQYERLYSSMKGLREMSEERNRNWEVALERLAGWILEEKGVQQRPRAIGPLVGQAMQAIGAQLIDDQEIMDPRGGGELAASMDPDADDGEFLKGIDGER